MFCTIFLVEIHNKKEMIKNISKFKTTDEINKDVIAATPAPMANHKKKKDGSIASTPAKIIAKMTHTPH
jgi:hypothetical protein